MKILLALLGGAVLGAAAVYLGFTQQLVKQGSGSGSERLVQINRFTGEAKEVFVSSFDANRLSEAEDAKDSAASEAFEAAQLAKQPPAPSTETTSESTSWKELPKEEIDKLGIRFQFSQGRYYARWHNHLDKPIRIETIRAEVPAAEGKEAVDRTYRVDWETRGLTDDGRNLEASLSDYPDGTVKLTPVKVSVLEKNAKSPDSLSPFAPR
ncbi:hypothetical protein [Verrucomicrobium sp. BvORR106]|uniref:hypothetical protein n=1 Tax=Verrucomicrobium sp. BvORR106 TaxID=1403819 RepID=UPI0005704C94|nr:hypothetical protein [Verrucomicrobium sp. BvORR106]